MVVSDILGWVVRIGALVVMLTIAGPAMAGEHAHHEEASARIQMHSAGHVSPCGQHDHHQPQRGDEWCCHGISVSCTSLLAPAVAAPMSPAGLSYGKPVSQAGNSLVGLSPPSEPPRA